MHSSAMGDRKIADYARRRPKLFRRCRTFANCADPYAMHSCAFVTVFATPNVVSPRNARNGHWNLARGGVEPGLRMPQAAALEALKAGVHGRMEEVHSPLVRRKRQRIAKPPQRRRSKENCPARILRSVRLCTARVRPETPHVFCREAKKNAGGRTTEFGVELIRVV